MITLNRTFRLVSAATAVLAITLMAGCGKKDSATTTVPNSGPAPEAAAAPQPAAPVPANAPAPVRTANPNTSLADAQAAMQARDYEKAAAALLSVQNQRQPLTPEQGLAVRNQMIQLQQSLGSAVARGDPKAKAAAALLRQSSMR